MKTKVAEVIESFSSIDASRITTVPYQTIDYWDRTGFISPSITKADGRGTERRYTFNDLIALRLARELRKAGASMQALRKIQNGLRDSFRDAKNPFSKSRLIVVGSDVALIRSSEAGTNDVISLLRKPGQMAFPVFVCDGPKTIRALHKKMKSTPIADAVGIARRA